MFGLPPEMRKDGTATMGGGECPCLTGIPFGKREGPRTNGNLPTVSRLLVQVARLLAHHASQPAHIPAILLLP